MTNTNKELNWNNPGVEEAQALFASHRGGYIVGQALYKAIEIMEKEDYPELSNIDDMKLIMGHLFPIFSTFAKLRKESEKMLAASPPTTGEHAAAVLPVGEVPCILDLTGQTELTASEYKRLSVEQRDIYNHNSGNYGDILDAGIAEGKTPTEAMADYHKAKRDDEAREQQKRYRARQVETLPVATNRAQRELLQAVAKSVTN